MTSAAVTSDAKSKISKFENSEREKAEKEEKERQKALFARKLSKFGENSDKNSNKQENEINSKVKFFTEAPGAEERQRESQRKKSEFEKIKSNFSPESAAKSVEESSAAVQRLPDDRVRMFSGPVKEEDPDAKRIQEEEEKRKAEQFESKRNVFAN